LICTQLSLAKLHILAVHAIRVNNGT